jgi:hypothetical protein
MGMSPACRDQYNLCLSGCPQPPPNLTGDPQGVADLTTPSCVEDCNQHSKGCR